MKHKPGKAMPFGHTGQKAVAMKGKVKEDKMKSSKKGLVKKKMGY